MSHHLGHVCVCTCKLQKSHRVRFRTLLRRSRIVYVVKRSGHAHAINVPATEEQLESVHATLACAVHTKRIIACWTTVVRRQRRVNLLLMMMLSKRWGFYDACAMQANCYLNSKHETTEFSQLLTAIGKQTHTQGTRHTT